MTAALSEAFAVQLRAPPGGGFVPYAVDGVLGFIGLVAGTLIAAPAVIAL